MWRICISKILAVFLPGHKKTQASCVHGDFLVITTMAMVPYMRPAGGQCRKKGLTLLELLVAMVIISVVLAVAVPVAMSGRYAENGFNNLQRQLRGELAILRNEAIGRGTTTRMQLTA